MKIIHAQREIFNDAISLYMAEDRIDGRWIVEPVKIKLTIEGAFSEPFLKLDMTTAQALMDELWNCGIRPSEGSGSAGSLAATERHLKDMQRLVFKDKQTMNPNDFKGK